MNSNSEKNSKILERLIGNNSAFTIKKLLGLGILSVILLILAVLSGLFIMKRFPGATGAEPVFVPPPSLEEIAQQYPQFAFLLDDTEIDSVYKEFLLVYQDGGPQAALELAEARGLLNAKKELRLTLELDTSDVEPLKKSLEMSGIQVTASSQNLVDIAIPLALIERAILSGDPAGVFSQITGLEHVVRIRLPRTNLHDRGEIETESLGMINTPVWHAAGFTGLGVKIGVLDLGFKHYRSLLGSDLPDTVTVRSFIAGVEMDQTDSEHGTAVGEIIYDIAPDAELFFAAYDTDVEEFQAIDWLIDQGVQIISHSASSIYGPMDGSSIEASYVNQVVEDGVLWVNSAGNMGENHYRAVFVDEDGDGFHEFEPGDEMLSFRPDGRVAMALNWNAWDTGDQDLDLFIMDADGNRVASSENYQTQEGDEAAEFISYRFDDDGPYYVVISASSITREVVLDFFIYNSVELEYITPAYSVTTPGDAKLALTVGATYWPDDSLEYYSSQGPTTDGRLKPDISGPTGVNSVAYGKEFYGTSASTPHVSGAAALVKSAFPNASALDIKDFLLSRAIDLGPSGADTQFGYGRLWLGEAPSQVFQPTVTPVDEQVIPTATEVALPVVTLPATLEAKPVIEPVPTTIPESDEEGTGWIWIAGLLVCVVLPGFLGLVGIGVVLIVWLSRGKKTRSEKPKVVYEPTPVGPKPSFGKEHDAGKKTPQKIERYTPPVKSEQRGVEPAISEDETIPCIYCRHLNRGQARFCVHCGKDLQGDDAPEQIAPAYCIYCGQKLRPESKFCPNCGKSVQ
ncbi:MAG TPA: S8 family serine peptidase [Anaerolineales bacterium]|nr:S8 family serine peptidase [Anaerolineales bacterium]